ncbi:CHAT domain-containing tetratricopeptide repeat protein [Hyalangium versicolor]|uniref:CHAT domain-containing tetratricopeptide repeat protein n=1 Tax=Hyalangium versicolor TaxID=2861190 RepID=UPI001CCE59D3|nr:tetratricopeptide repeat protein [Hyalangium versicolor]
MRQGARWLAIALVCWTGGVASGAGRADARLQEAQKAFEEATRLREAGRYAEAIALGERALALREAALGRTNPEVARCLELLGTLHLNQGDTAGAEPLLQRGLDIQAATLGKEHPDVATSLDDLGRLYSTQGLYARAEPLYQRALAIREAVLGKRHPDVASTLNNLAVLYANQGLYERALPFYERALSIWESSLGPKHPHVATLLNNLARLYQAQGLYKQAEPLYQRALSIKEAVRGKNHPSFAQTLNNLAILYTEQGLYERAEPLYQRALSILEGALGKNHPDISYPLNNLASLYMEQGFHGRAGPPYERALAIREKALGARHPLVADSLGNLASLYSAQGLYARAEPLCQRALSIQEAVLGKNHPDVASTLNNLAILYANQGLYERARPLLERALSIREAVLGKDHPDVASTINNLALSYAEQGNYGRAGALFERALAIYEKSLGSRHPLVANVLNNLARIRLAQQRLDEALPLYTRAFAISEQRLRQEALDFSESRLASFLQYLRADEERLYALLRAHPSDARVRRLALSAALLLKGRSVEETADTSRIIYRSLGFQDREALDRLRGLRTRLAKQSLDGPGPLNPVEYQRHLETLARQGDALEAELARRSAPLRALAGLPSPGEIVDRVAASLPKDSALVEFIAYSDRPLLPRPGASAAKGAGQLRYLALVLAPGVDIRALDLGPAAPIDGAASRLRSALADRDASFQAMAQELYRRVFQPLLPLLNHSQRLLLSPDGQLGLVPFAALHDGRQFLVDAFDITYLTSGKDVLPRTQDMAPSSRVVVLADPDFTPPPRMSVASSQGVPGQAERSTSLESFFSSVRSDLAERSWTPLPGTRREAEAIRRLIPQTQLFLGAEATKERLLNLPTPGVLHLATHGFFLEDAPVPEGARALGNFGALGRAPPLARLPDPLLRSGLVLAGTRALTPSSSGAAKSAPDSSMVTALELAGLNLWGTQLVVLSACDTGRGDVKLGQGVYGLRRAFVVAGAETVVMSLWKVNDETTRQLMESYYRNLLEGQGRAAALREAMRALRHSQPHPHYWAPFIVVGRDAPLRALKADSRKEAGE